MSNNQIYQSSKEVQVNLLNAHKSTCLLRSLLSSPQETGDPLITSFYGMFHEAIAEDALHIHIQVRGAVAEILYRVCREDGSNLVLAGESSRSFAELFVDAVRSIDMNDSEINCSGVVSATVNNSDFPVRIAASSCDIDGYDCVLRLLPIEAPHRLKASDLKSLGYSREQAAIITAPSDHSIADSFCSGSTATFKSSLLAKLLKN